MEKQEYRGWGVEVVKGRARQGGGTSRELEQQAQPLDTWTHSRVFFRTPHVAVYMRSFLEIGSDVSMRPAKQSRLTQAPAGCGGVRGRDGRGSGTPQPTILSPYPSIFSLVFLS
jgi:hypothetical protein